LFSKLLKGVAMSGVNKTHWKQNFDYKYTGAYELEPGEERTLTIARTASEKVKDTRGDEQVCLVAYFREHSKPMVLNKTNCKTIEKLYGPFIEEWAGKRIVIMSKKVSAFGDEVDALRVKKSLPSPEIKINSELLALKIRACTTLDELKTTFTSLTPQEQAVVVAVKDEMKNKLTSEQAVK
jgi:hypothetical protein